MTLGYDQSARRRTPLSWLPWYPNARAPPGRPSKQRCWLLPDSLRGASCVIFLPLHIALRFVGSAAHQEFLSGFYEGKARLSRGMVICSPAVIGALCQLSNSSFCLGSPEALVPGFALLCFLLFYLNIYFFLSSHPFLIFLKFMMNVHFW